MINDNSFPETHSGQYSFVDLVEQSQLSLKPEFSLSLGNELEYFNQNYLELSALDNSINTLQASQDQTDLITGLNLVESLEVGQPDLIVSALSLSSSIRAGSNVSISYTLKNIGNAVAISSQTKYYLSSDTTFDSNDLELGNNYPTSINAGASQTRSDSVTFNGNLSIGSYYFLVVADSTNLNLESNETNNIFFLPLQITKPDLVVDSSSLTVPSSLVAGQVVKFNYTVKNQGDTSSVSSMTKYYLSTDMDLDSSDIYLGNDTVSAIASGASLTRADSVTLNSTLNPGNYFFLTQVDASNTCIESNETNNIFPKAIALQGAPDLILNTSNITSSVAAGGIISIPHTIQNIGLSTAISSTTQFYLSKNTTYESTDISLGVTNIVAIAAGESAFKVKTFTISFSVPAGNYYVIGRADTRNSVKESNETNNLFSSLGTIKITKPDLEITQFALSTPNELTVGSPINVSYTIANTGNATAKASITKYYLSSDGIFDPSDSYLGDDSVSALGVGATLNKTDSFVLNTSLENGIYYFLAIADSTNVVAETNENNNLIYQTITINNVDQPDLIIAPLAGSLVANRGSNLSLSYTIENQGSLAAQASTTKFYLSTDTILDSNDIFLFSDAVEPLASNTTSLEQANIAIGNNLNTGTYYLLAQADSESVITENDETNNIVYQSLEIVEPPKPDLLFDNLTIPNTVTPNSNLLVSYTIRNQGNANANASLTRFYLSTDTILDSSDIELGSDNLASVTSNTSSIKDLTLAIGSNINPGSYYLLAKADSNSVLTESNENNNLIAQMLQVSVPPKPDLVINTLATPSQIDIGSSLVIAYSIQNQGNANSAASTTNFYLSIDTTLDNNDIVLLSDDVAALAGNAESTEDTILTIGNSIIAGTYYLLAQADSEAVVNESNENNNLSYQTIEITEPEVPDLIINPLSITVRGLNLSVSYTLKNQSTLGVGASNTKFYLSSNNVLEATDTLLGTDAVAALSIQTASVESVALTLANNLNAGTYYILAQADSDNAIAESNETNNIASTTIQIASDLIISNFSVSNGLNKVTQGYGFIPTYTLKNLGNASSGTSNTKYVVSRDAILGNADDFLPTRLSNSGADAGLASGASRVENNDYLVIYDNITPGFYHLFAIADSTNTVAENNENNNALSIFIDFALPPKPDLIVDKLNVLSSTHVGSSLNLSYTTRNIDTGYAGYSHLSFYLSADNVVDSSDFVMGYHMVSSSSPYNIPISRERSLFLNPANVSPGTYNLIAKIDPSNGINESNETNNIFIHSITINPLLQSDLSITNVSLTSFETDSTSGNPILETGSLITLPYTISNTGGAIGRNQTNFYLSTDSVYNSTDILVGSYSTLSLNTRSSKEVSASIYLNPSAITLGTNTYYLIAQADAGLTTTAESNEANNFTAYQVIINNSGTTNFSNTKGYGFINAAAAVAASLGVTPFADVPNVNTNWGVDLIKAPEVHAHGYTGLGITVAVIDTGVDYNHPDLINNIWVNVDEIAGNGIDDDLNGFIDDVKGWDFVGNDNTPLGTDGHGTHVAGIIAASRNSIGHTGVAYNAKIMPLKVLGGGDQWGNVNNAIRYAVDNGARVINMSLGGSTSDPDGRLKEALQYAHEFGVIVVSAAGNDGASSPIMPASFATQWGIAVGATGNTGALTSYSNKAGTQATIAYVTAPGTSTSTLPNNKYGKLSGTSMATPHVAGVVALMLSANPDLTDAQVRQILTQTAITGTISSTILNESDLENTIIPFEGTLTLSLEDLSEQSLAQLDNLTNTERSPTL
jgi:subtilase family serine protease